MRFLTLALLVMAATLFARAKEAFPQSKQLEEGILIRLEDAWIYDQKTDTKLLRVLFTYQGGDPNKKYRISAFLKADGKRIDSQFVWQVGIPKTEGYQEGELPIVWEFKEYPNKADALHLELVLVSVTDSAQVRSLDYALPRPQRLRSRDGSVSRKG